MSKANETNQTNPAALDGICPKCSRQTNWYILTPSGLKLYCQRCWIVEEKTDDRDQFEAAVRKLLSYLPDFPGNSAERIDGVGILIPPKYINEVARLLGPEPKDPPKETQ